MISVSHKMLPVRHLLFATTLLVIFQQPRHAANVFGSAQNGRRVEIRPSVSAVYLEAQSTQSNKVLTCKAVGDQPGLFSELRWTGPGRTDNWEELRKKHKIRERNGHVELEFIRPSPDDSGVYHCSGTFQSSDYYDASIQVKVYNPIKLENCREQQFIIEGEPNQKVSCRVTGDSPSLVVYKDDKQIESTNPRYKWDAKEDGIKILKPVDITDAGTYIVEVTTDLTGDRRVQEIRVEVHSKSSIVPYSPVPGSHAEYIGIEGQQAELKCHVKGNPKPLVYWFDPKKRNLTTVGGYFVNPEQGTLIISKVNRVDDNGNFICLAKNDVSEASRPVSMAVFVRPEIVKFENKTVEEGQEVTFECRATGYPRPTFSIRRQGLNQLPYSLGDEYVTAVSETEEGGGAQVYVYRVRINANRTNYGIHYCNATNLAGNGPESINQLFVKYKPDLSLTPAVQYAKLGKNVTVLCHIRAYPAPTVNWFNDLGQQILNAQTSFLTSPDGQTHFGTIMPPSSTEGRYRCSARNDLGHKEQIIEMRFKQKPGAVNAVVHNSTPTTVELILTVSNDGGDGVKSFLYKVEGTTNDPYNPTFSYRRDIQNETYIDAVSQSSIYTIRNLLPNYKYTLTIRAVNELGPGDVTELQIETRKPTRPEAPVIIKPNVVSSAQFGFTSDYQNGYVLHWRPPDLDNGDLVTLYLIKIDRVNPELPDIVLDEGEARLIEQSNERPLHARLGPLESNRYYRIQVQARNKYGESEPAKIIIYTSPDRPAMPDFGPEALTWLTEPSTPILIGLLILAIICLIIIDVTFCFCYQIGVSYSVKSCCCPQKANSVISDNTYT